MSVEILLMTCMSVWRFRDALRLCVRSLAWHCTALAAFGHKYPREGRPIEEDDNRRLYDYNGWAGMCAMGLAFSYRYGGDDNKWGGRSLTGS